MPTPPGRSALDTGPDAPLGLTVTTEVAGEVGLVRPDGDVEISTFALVRDATRRLLDRGVMTVVVDCAAIDFIDSTGLALFVDVNRFAERAGARFRLRNVSEQQLTLLRITGLTEVLDIEPS